MEKMNLQEVINNEKFRFDDGEILFPNINGRKYERVMMMHNESLDRIAEAAKKPRVMKRWTDECKPKIIIYWKGWIACRSQSYKDYGIVHIIPEPVSIFSDTLTTNSYKCESITHWLELEPTPTLPDGEDE